MKTRFKSFGAAIALALVVPIAACSGKADADAEGEASSGTLASAISADSDLRTLSGALSEAGLSEVFDGPGSYTVLAPSDSAFTALGQQGKSLTAPDHRAELVAILRGHILPGHLTAESIRQAIEAKKGPVTMRTLDDAQVTFSEEGSKILVSGESGAKATLGTPIAANNGVVLPIDGLVKRPVADAGS